MPLGRGGRERKEDVWGRDRKEHISSSPERGIFGGLERRERRRDILCSPERGIFGGLVGCV